MVDAFMRCVLIAAFSGSLLLAAAAPVSAGPPPAPIEVHADLAKRIVVGRINKIEPANDAPVGGIRWGRATLEVKEVLKGPPATTIECRVTIGKAPNYGGAQAVRIRKVGDAGIWLIDADDAVSGSFGLISEARRADLQQVLKTLADRKWSEPVNGLRAWAATVNLDYEWNAAAKPEKPKHPVVIFAVQNVSAADIFVPVAQSQKFVSARANQGGGTSYFSLGPAVNDFEPAVFCRKLAPGETRYLHPNDSCINLVAEPRKAGMRDGKYTVVVQCENTRAGEIHDWADRKIPVAAWKGTLQAPPVEFVLARQATPKNAKLDRLIQDLHHDLKQLAKTHAWLSGYSDSSLWDGRVIAFVSKDGSSGAAWPEQINIHYKTWYPEDGPADNGRPEFVVWKFPSLHARVVGMIHIAGQDDAKTDAAIRECLAKRCEALQQELDPEQHGTGLSGIGIGLGALGTITVLALGLLIGKFL